MATIDIIREILSENQGIDPALVTEDATFETLGIDSLDTVELICELEDRLEIDFGEPEGLNTLGDMIAYIGKDRDDAIRVGVIDDLSTFDSNYIGRGNSQIINNMTVDIVNNSYGQDHIAMSKAAFDDIVLAKKQNYQKIYYMEGTVSEFENIVQ